MKCLVQGMCESMRLTLRSQSQNLNLSHLLGLTPTDSLADLCAPPHNPLPTYNLSFPTTL